MQVSKNPEDAEAIIDRYSLNTVVISGMDRAGLPTRNRAGTRRLTKYLEERYPESVSGRARVFRVRP